MDPIDNGWLIWKGAAVAAWFLVFFAAERLAPSAPLPDLLRRAGKAGTRSRLARNLALWLVNVVISPLVVLPLSIAASAAAPSWRPDAWSGWPGLLLDVVLLDFLIYWWHRANHRIGFLWRFHEVHHLDRTLDTTTALRFHFGEVLLSALARAGVIFVLDVPIASVLVFESLVLVAAIFHHSNLRLPSGLERRLGRVVITPAIHWVHHHARQIDTDSNYGTIFSFWDPVFASRNPLKRTPLMAIGVEGRDERPLAHLFARPFLSAARRAAAADGG